MSFFVVASLIFVVSYQYYTGDCCLSSDSSRRSLRSADGPTCAVPCTLSSYGDRTFAELLVCGTYFLSSCVILWIVQTTAEGTPFSGFMSMALCDLRYVPP